MKHIVAGIILSVCSLLYSVNGYTLRVEPYIAIGSSPTQVYYGSTSFYYYPNHLIVPGHYSQKSIRDMVRLSRQLGWREVYLLPPGYNNGLPYYLEGYTRREFNRYGMNYYYYNPQPVYQYRYYDRGYYDRGHYDRGRYYDRHHRRDRGGSGLYFRFSF